MQTASVTKPAKKPRRPRGRSTPETMTSARPDMTITATMETPLPADPIPTTTTPEAARPAIGRTVRYRGTDSGLGEIIDVKPEKGLFKVKWASGWPSRWLHHSSLELVS